jgi:hypothetical protein
MSKIISFLIVGLVFFGETLSAQMQGASPVGEVVVANGSIRALDANQNVRSLTKKSSIFVADTIEVGENSLAGIQMLDGSVITLVANTKYRIESFIYKSSSSKDNFVSQLSKGGFRLLSGDIGKRNPEKYEIRTENGTIGLLGTVVEGLMQDDSLYVHVNKGRATLTNAAGTVTIGTGTVEYAVISRFDELPQTLVSRPAQLTPHYFVPQVRPGHGH